MTKYELTNVIIQAVTAAAAIVVALLAVYGDAIRRWLFRPHLDIRTGNQAPFLELMTLNEESGSTSTSQEIRIQVLNSGKSIARNCKVVVDSLYEQRAGAGDMFLAKEFIPRPCLWDNEQKTQDLLPKIPTYVFVARISEKGEMATEDSSTSSSRTCALYIMIEERKGVFLEVAEGKHIFPLALYADNISKPVKRYLEIFWDGKTPSDTCKAHFNIQLHTESEFQTIMGGAK